MEPTFFDNSALIDEAWRLRQCLLMLSRAGVVVERYKSGPVILIDSQTVPSAIEANKTEQGEFYQTEIMGCRLVWKITKEDDNEQLQDL